MTKLTGAVYGTVRGKPARRQFGQSLGHRMRLEILEARVVPTVAVVQSIAIANPTNPYTDATSVVYAVTFNQDVTGLSASAFRVTTNDSVQVASPVLLAGSGASYLVTVAGIRGSGSLRLDLVDDDTVLGLSSGPLGGSGAGNGSFQGETYFISQVYPHVVSINRTTPPDSLTRASSVSYTVTFSESVLGVDPTDFTLHLTGSVTATTPVSVSGSGATYTVTINGLAGVGTLGLNLVDDGSIHDAAGNPLMATDGAALLQAPTTFASGAARAYAVAVADLDGDGKPDLVVANRNPGYAGKIGVLLGDGQGAFQTATTYTVGNSPTSVAVADVNGDGIPDIIATNYLSRNISVLLGNGDGTFQGQQTLATGLNPASIQVADLNGDGKPDLAYVQVGQNNVATMLGNGDGTFRTPVTFSSGAVYSGPRAVAATDLNGDGKLDLVVANQGTTTVGVLLGNGDGTFQSATTFLSGINPVSMAIADVNGDGAPDVLLANYSNASYANVLLGNGNGTLRPFISVPVGPKPNVIVAGDINGDGHQDLIVANYFSSTDSLVLGNGDGTFQSQLSFAAGVQAHGLAVADINGDGRPDIIAANKAYGSPSGFLSIAASTNGDFTGQIYTLPAVSATTTTLAGSLAVAAFGQSVTFTATIGITTPNGFTPSGTVTFKDFGTTIGVAAVAGNLATFTTSTLGAGPHSITADYSGDAGFSGSSSGPVGLTVSPNVVKSGNTVTITGDALSNAYVFSYSSGTSYQVLVNGVVFTFDPATVSVFNFVGASSTDSIVLHGSAGVENFDLRPTAADMTGLGPLSQPFAVHARNIRIIAVDGGGGTDRAVAHTSAVTDDAFVGVPGNQQGPAYGALYAVDGSYYNVVYHSQVVAMNDSGDAGTHSATLITSGADDNLVGTPDVVLLAGAGAFGSGAFDFSAAGYPVVVVQNPPSNTGVHTATLLTSSVASTFVAVPNEYAVLQGTDPGAAFRNILYNFSSVVAINNDSVPGIRHDALLFSSFNNDSFVATSTAATLVGTTSGSVYSFTALKFSNVSAFNQGGAGQGVAQLSGSEDNDVFVGTASYGLMTNGSPNDALQFRNVAYGFSSVVARVLPGSQHTRAAVFDAAGDNIYTGRFNIGVLLGNVVVNFAEVDAYFINGGTNTIDNASLNYIFRPFGNYST